MTTEKLAKPTWHTYFDSVSKALSNKQAEVDVQSLELGAQVEAQFSPLLGIVYDPNSDELEILLEGLGHNIDGVTEIYVEHDGTNLKSVEAIDQDGVKHIVRLRDPVALPAPSRAASPG